MMTSLRTLIRFVGIGLFLIVVRMLLNRLFKNLQQKDRADRTPDKSKNRFPDAEDADWEDLDKDD